jgi:hypothetical protein
LEIHNRWYKNKYNEMKIKRFNEMHDVDFANTIADAVEAELNDLMAKSMPYEEFMKMMKSRGADETTTDLVLSELVNRGFSFD